MTKAATEGDWFVVRTNIRCERRAARSLRAAGYKVYYPTFRRSVLHRRTKKRIIRRYSLMPGYIFVRMTRWDWYTLRRCDGVEAVMGISGRPIAIPRADVVRFMTEQRARKHDHVYIERVPARTRRRELEKVFRRGARVRAKEGPMGGLDMEVDGVTAQGRVAVLMDLFGRLTPVEFDPDDVEALDIAEAA